MTSRLIWATALTTVVLSAPAASAFEFTGAEATLGFNQHNRENSSSDYRTTVFAGAAVVSFGQFGAQLDLGGWEYDSGPEGNTYVTLHAFYDITPDLRAGVYVGRDN